MIPYGRHEITQADIDSVVSVLKSDFITQGTVVGQFEKVVAEHVGAIHAVAVNSATSALHVACLALGLGQEDWLWTTPITFVASANCGLYCGAQIDFVDIDPRTYNISPQALEEKLIDAEKSNRLPKVVVVVHMCGQSCDMDNIRRLSLQYGFRIIEDASHAIGGKYKGGYIGGCQYSDVTIFSFHPVKIITTAEGGMALTNNEELAKKMSLLRSHGITRDENQMKNVSDGPWYYQQIELGFNYRMTELQAALGISQMDRLEEYVLQRNQIAIKYNKGLECLPVAIPWVHPDTYSAFHLYVVRLKLEEVSCARRQVFENLRSMGVNVNLHYIPVHTQPYYQKMGFKLGDYPESERYYEEVISLPIFPLLTDEQNNYIISAVVKSIG